MKKAKNWRDYTLKSLVFWVIAGIIAGIFCGYFLTDRQDAEISALMDTQESVLVSVTLPKDSDKSVQLLLAENSAGDISVTTDHLNGTYSALVTSSQKGEAVVIYDFNFRADTSVKKLIFTAYESKNDGAYRIRGDLKLHINFGEGGVVESLGGQSADMRYLHHTTDVMGLGVNVKKGIDVFIWVLKLLVGPIIFLTIILGIVGLESLK
ncbi:MAG: hypothetical protein LBP40_01545, partial [Campylobacteraceae bacterium]|nr:hypothetical protein [Campylobacteraceae bacterium]